jgi:arsenate reductase-like glutaredoxin family protein
MQKAKSFAMKRLAPRFVCGACRLANDAFRRHSIALCAENAASCTMSRDKLMTLLNA